MTRPSLLLAAAALVAAGTPVYATTAAPVLNGPCSATQLAGATALVPGAEASSSVVETPVGAGNLSSADAGTFVVDLSGLEKGKKSAVTFTLEMDSVADGLQDYDLVVDGVNELSSDSPEVHTTSAKGHCARIVVQTEVFTGLPTDTLTLSAKAGALR